MVWEDILSTLKLGDNPARLLIECWLTLVRGSSRADRVAVEALIEAGKVWQ